MDEINGFFIINEKSKRIPNVNTGFQYELAVGVIPVQVFMIRFGFQDLRSTFEKYKPLFRFTGKISKIRSTFTEIRATCRKIFKLQGFSGLHDSVKWLSDFDGYFID